jgi:K+-transporting ATPase KdpF subunit
MGQRSPPHPLAICNGDGCTTLHPASKQIGSPAGAGARKPDARVERGRVAALARSLLWTECMAPFHIEYIIGIAVSLLLVGYLVYALLRPERF